MNSPYEEVLGVKSIGGVSFPSGDITGSCHGILLQTQKGINTHLYDFGLFQGAEKKNTEDFPPEFLEAESGVIGHSHADHSARLARYMYERKKAGIKHDITFLGSDIVQELYMPIGLQGATIEHENASFASDLISTCKVNLDRALNNWRGSFGAVRRIQKSQKPRGDHKKPDLLRIARKHTLTPDFYENVFLSVAQSIFLSSSSKFYNPKFYQKINDLAFQIPEGEKNKKPRNSLFDEISTFIHDFFQDERAKLPPDLRTYVVEAAHNFKNLSRDGTGREFFQINPFLKVEFYNTAHTLGSRGALYTVTLANGEIRRLYFMGDVGRADDTSLLGNPEFPDEELDFCTMEGTYAGKPDHPERGPELENLQKFILSRTREAILMPVFQFQRGQDMAVILAKMKQRGDLPHSFQILMAGSLFPTINEAFARHSTSYEVLEGQLHVKMINRAQKEQFKKGKLKNAVLLTAGGSGDIGASLEYIHDARNVILCGYQFPGSIGARLANGEEIHDMNVDPKNLLVLRSLSGHASENQLLSYAELMRWKILSLVHGTPDNLTALSQKIPVGEGQRVVIPQKGELIQIG